MTTDQTQPVAGRAPQVRLPTATYRIQFNRGFTFADARVRARLSGWTLLQVDVTENSDADRALLQRFGLYGPPAILFFARGGKEIAGVRVVGFQNADEFLGLLSGLG